MRRPFDAPRFGAPGAPLFGALAQSFCAALLALLASCGGGGGVVGSGGTGSTPLGVAEGTVNGFGSVIVDDAAFDDRAAPVLVEDAPSHDAAAVARLGQRVRVEYEAGGVARTVQLEPALIGPVARGASAGQFVVLGQTVQVNADAAAGPLTQFGGGYAGAADIQPGDLLEVHGVLAVRAAAEMLQATRIDRLTASPAFLRVGGTVRQLTGGAAANFRLGAVTIDLGAAPVLPAGSVLGNGQAVAVLVPAVTLAAKAARLPAAQVRIVGLGSKGLDDVVSGSVTKLDAAARTFMLGGLVVRYGNVAILPAGTVLAEGLYVRVQGMADANGVLVAASVVRRSGESSSSVKGNVVGLDRAAVRFTVRGVAIDAARASFEGCSAATLANGVFVEVEGTLNATGMAAAKVHCDSEPAGATLEREGVVVAGSVDLAARSFQLRPEDRSAITVRWTESTYFGGLTAATMAGRKVQVQGAFDASVLVASAVKLGD